MATKLADALRGALASKTVWTFGAVSTLGFIDWTQNNAGLIAAILPEAGPLLMILGGVGIILRALTKESLPEKGEATRTDLDATIQ